MFKVGDRVAVYGAVGARTYFRGNKGEVISVTHHDELLVKVETQEYGVHPKQCRLLKRKERRRIWIKAVGLDGFLGGCLIKTGEVGVSNHPKEGYLEFREVRRK